MRGFWQRQQRAFVDVRVFYPFPRKYQNLKSLMNTMEKKNKKKYNEQVLQEEHCSFTLLVFTSDRGMSNETKRFCMRLSELTREKNVTHYSETSASIKRKTCCSLLRSAVICICG